MGRITLFTADDIHSKFLKMELEKRDLPYVEISLTVYPDRRKDLKLLASTMAVPKVFFNTRHVGGVKEAVEELSSKWDKSKRFGSPRERFDFEIADQPDPSSALLAQPPSGQQASITNNEEELRRSQFKKLKLLPNEVGSGMTVLEITEILRNSLPAHRRRYKNLMYPKSFSGKEAVHSFMTSMNLSEAEAVSYGIALQNARILDHVADFSIKTGKFRNSDKQIYRLQCNKDPQVLNSYRVWNESKANHSSPSEIMSYLDELMTNMETESVNSAGKVSYERLSHSSKLPVFEEAVCELQRVSLVTMDSTERMVFAINLFRVMLRYAFVKVGTVSSDSELKAYFNHVQFNVGGNLYSFREWYDGLLRSNKKSVFGKVAFNRLDSRRKFALPKFDERVHFALYAGAAYGSTCSLPFRQFTAENIENELDTSAAIFCADPVYLNINMDSASRKVGMSKLLDWYQADFAKNPHGVLEALGKNVEGYQKMELRASLSDKRSLKISVNDLDLNSNSDEYTTFNMLDVLPKMSAWQSKIRRRFEPPKTPENEESRLETLRQLNVLDSLQEDRYDRITAEVKEYFNVPIVFVSLVDKNRQWFKSTQWSCSSRAPVETKREISFCGHAIVNANADMLIVPDALKDDRFADNPFVTGPMSFRFYAGYVLSLPAADGDSSPVNVGTLCIIDQQPREPLTPQETEKLRAFGERVVKELVKDESTPVPLTKVFEDKVDFLEETDNDLTDFSDESLPISEDEGDDKLFSIKYNRYLPATETEDERIRLSTLRSLNVLDTASEERYNAITASVKEYFDVPIVLVSLVDENRQWFKSAQWKCSVPQPSQTGRDISFCGHAINNGSADVFIVPNAVEDPRFADNPLVTGALNLRFYAGYVLSVPAADGGPPVHVGTLCIIDQKPHNMLSEDQLAKLRSFGHLVEQELIRHENLERDIANQAGESILQQVPARENVVTKQ